MRVAFGLLSKTKRAVSYRGFWANVKKCANRALFRSVRVCYYSSNGWNNPVFVCQDFSVTRHDDGLCKVTENHAGKETKEDDTITLGASSKNSDGLCGSVAFPRALVRSGCFLTAAGL